MPCTCEGTAQCDPITGSCDKCPPGFIGVGCQQPCPINTYGDNCQGDCGCYINGMKSCDGASGQCYCAVSTVDELSFLLLLLLLPLVLYDVAIPATELRNGDSGAKPSTCFRDANWSKLCFDCYVIHFHKLACSLNSASRKIVVKCFYQVWWSSAITLKFQA